MGSIIVVVVIVVLGMMRLGGGQAGPALKLVSLDGLGLDAVRERQAGCCCCCDSVVVGRRRPMLQASWCSMKLSTLHTCKHKGKL